MSLSYFLTGGLVGLIGWSMKAFIRNLNQNSRFEIYPQQILGQSPCMYEHFHGWSLFRDLNPIVTIPPSIHSALSSNFSFHWIFKKRIDKIVIEAERNQLMDNENLAKLEHQHWLAMNYATNYYEYSARWLSISWTRKLIRWFSWYLHKKHEISFTKFSDLNGSRRLHVLWWLTAGWCWWRDSHPLNLLFKLLMHVFDEIVILLPVVFSRRCVSVDD